MESSRITPIERLKNRYCPTCFVKSSFLSIFSNSYTKSIMYDCTGSQESSRGKGVFGVCRKAL
ncbi:zinc-finger domain-containing protein [Arthrospiribacter ruber]|uniref:Zinc-finger domain-containing protein n=1 Tax=Arthrospiribacter ruber TaxID=2487934 RepID=A0A951MJP9_9BACT|nr:zinc-finger domain-containing protein [Arthrospiribacter ruber]